VGRCSREEFTIYCRMTDVGSEGGASSRRRQGGLGAEPPAFGDFYNFFNKNNTFLGIFRLKFLLKIFS